MVAGAALNLQHVWLSRISTSDTILFRQAILLGKPPAAPNNLFSPNVQAGSLRSLRFGDTGGDGIDSWAARADWSKLSHLELCWHPKWVDLAARLVSLRDLTLDGIDSYGSPTICQLLTSLDPNSLQSLYLHGHIDEALFNTLLVQHGQSLRRLSLLSHTAYDGFEWEDNPPPPPFVLTPALSARLAETCPNLELLELLMNRTQGDARECGVYRAL